MLCVGMRIVGELWPALRLCDPRRRRVVRQDQGRGWQTKIMGARGRGEDADGLACGCGAVRVVRLANRFRLRDAVAPVNNLGSEHPVWRPTLALLYRQSGVVLTFSLSGSRSQINPRSCRAAAGLQVQVQDGYGRHRHAWASPRQPVRRERRGIPCQHRRRTTPAEPCVAGK